jgi:hypothetical protein
MSVNSHHHKKFAHCLLPIAYCLLPIAFLLSSCQNKTKQLLVKKWDCVQVENIAPPNKGFNKKEDSVATSQMQELQAALTALSWVFNKNNTYQCSINERVTVLGNYEITADEKILICTPDSKNNVNSYTITKISESDLVLTSAGGATPLILHFRPN